MSGCPNVKPASTSRVGATRCPARSISSPIWPNAALTADAGNGKKAGRCSGTAECLDELLVRDDAGRDHVDRAGERLLEGKEIRGDGVVQRHPAPPLASTADASARAQLERRQQPGERSTALRENDALAQVHRPEPCSPRRLGGRLPRLDDLGEEPRARHRVLVDDLVAAVAVEPCRGSTDEDGTARETGRGLGDQGRAVDAGVEHPAPNVVGPALADVLTCEMDDRLDAFERAVDRARLGIPLNLGRAGRRPTDEVEQVVPGRVERGSEGRPDEARMIR